MKQHEEVDVESGAVEGDLLVELFDDADAAEREHGDVKIDSPL